MSLRRLSFGAVLAGLVASAACNGLLENDPRELEHVGQGGDAGGGGGGDGGNAGRGGSGGNAGSEIDAGSHSSTTSSAGAAGEAAAAGAAGEAGAAGAPGAETSSTSSASTSTAATSTGETGAGGTTNVCEGTASECLPGDSEPDDPRPCACNLGTQSRTKTCSEGCVWSYGEWSACSVTPECESGSQEQVVNCPCGGTKTQSHSCTDACVWGPWTDVTACADLNCCTELVYCDTPNDIGVPASRGTWCRRKSSACTADEVLADCMADLGRYDCNLHEELYID